MRLLFFPILLLLGVLPCTVTAGDADPVKSVWLTGEIFTEGGVLFFRANKDVASNTKGRVVLLGTPEKYGPTLLPVYGVAAEKHVPLRLFGELRPVVGTIPGHSADSLPSVEFITWKVHAPSDPDELPAGVAIRPQPGDTIVEGWKVEKAR